MAYLALYRAFRPTSLNEVVRQEHIVTVLKNQISTNRIGHAYLFCGPRGTGKTSIAKIFAAAINCQSPVNGSACGKCEVCKALSDPANLDISEIDAASNNGVDEMRDLREKVQYPPVAGKYKVYIIDEVHMLSQGAFNALLKTLEEPPSHAVFILATTESAKIPATILSRCMRFDFKLIPQSDLEERLRFVFDSIGKKYDAEAIAAIARAGAGSVRDMLSIADTCVSYTSGKLTYEDVTAVLGGADFFGMASFCEAVLTGNNGVAFEKAESFLSAGKSVGVLVKDVMNFLNSCSVAKICRDAQQILALPESSFAEVLRIAKGTDAHALLRATEIFAEVEQTLKYSASPRIMFETAVLKASMPQVDYDIESLLARIAALESKMENGVVVQNAGGRIEMNAPIPVEVPPMAQPIQPLQSVQTPIEEVDEYDGAPELEPPPDEAVTGGNVYFDETNEPIQKKTVAKVVLKAAPTGDAKATFGAFLRSLRKIGKSGVLFAICMDMEYAYEDGVFTLYTESDTIYRSLSKDEHQALLRQSFEAIGIGANEFSVQLKGKKTDELDKGLQALKQTFGGVKMDIK